MGSVLRLKLYNNSALQNAGGGRIEKLLMGRADDRSVIVEDSRFIWAGPLNRLRARDECGCCWKR
jgi:hypothetical protein